MKLGSEIFNELIILIENCRLTVTLSNESEKADMFLNGFKICISTVLIHMYEYSSALRWRHNGRYSVSNHQPHDCLLNRLFRRRPKKTPKLRVTGLCVGNSPRTGEFPAQMASNAEMFPFDDVIMGIYIRAKFFRVNINIYLHFMSFLHIDLIHVLKILPEVR